MENAIRHLRGKCSREKAWCTRQATAPPASSCSSTTPLPSPLHTAYELERLARRDDALTGALVAYGIVAFLVAMAYCINAMLGGGGGSMLLSKSGLQGRQRRDSHQNAA